MSFSPEKYSLIVFHRGCSEVTGKLQVAIAPRKDIRMLGVIAHRKLLWKKHSEMIAQKLQTRSLAISRTMAATWGPRLHHARAIYSAIVDMLWSGLLPYPVVGECKRNGKGAREAAAGKPQMHIRGIPLCSYPQPGDRNTYHR